MASSHLKRLRHCENFHISTPRAKQHRQHFERANFASTNHTLEDIAITKGQKIKPHAFKQPAHWNLTDTSASLCKNTEENIQDKKALKHRLLFDTPFSPVQLKKSRLDTSSANINAMETDEISGPQVDVETSTSALASTSAGSGTATDDVGKKVDTPIFTMSQVKLICDSVVARREEELTEQFEAVVARRLAEQQEACVKFTCEQIERKMSKIEPTYFS